MADDLERVQEGYAAFARGDMPAVLSLLDPDVEWTEPSGYPWGRVYRGHHDVLGLFGTAAGMLGPGWQVVPDRYYPLDDGVLVLGRHVGAEGEDAWEVPFAMVWRMREGVATHFRQYGDTVLMREVAGRA